MLKEKGTTNQMPLLLHKKNMTKNIKRKTLKLKNNNNVIKIKIVKRDFWPEQKKKEILF